MSIVQKIRADLLTARKNRNTHRSGLLSTLLGDVEAVGKNAQRETTDAESVAVVKKFLKNVQITHEALMASESDVDDLLTHNLSEKLIYETFLPQQLSEAQLRVVLGDIIFSGATSVGDIMKALKSQHAGLYDGALASRLIKEID